MQDITIGSKFWIEKNGRFFLGKGRVELLKAVRETGSISAAAKSMNASYKKAWESIDAMNVLTDQPLVERTTGGRGGGGTVLTEEGEKAIQLYEVLIKNSAGFVESETEMLAQ
jgi:molybdate transport system regulatory protein